MPSYGRVFPSNLICVFPQLDLPVVRGGSDDVVGGVEADPIAASFMTIEHLNAFDLDSNKGTEILGFCQFFLKDRKVPNSDS